MKKSLPGLGLLLLLSIAAFQFCVQPPDYSDTPVIEFKSMTKDTLLTSRYGGDSTTIILSYTDGDGDLGSMANDTSSRVFLFDSRDNSPKAAYTLPFIEQQGAGNGISGDISIFIKSDNNAFKFCCIYGGNLPPCELDPAPQNTDTLTFKIYIKDRAGHVSNVVETAPIILICQK